MNPQPFEMGEAMTWLGGVSVVLAIVLLLLHEPLVKLEQWMLEWLERKERDEEKQD